MKIQVGNIRDDTRAHCKADETEINGRFEFITCEGVDALLARVLASFRLLD